MLKATKRMSLSIIIWMEGHNHTKFAIFPALIPSPFSLFLFIFEYFPLFNTPLTKAPNRAETPDKKNI